MNLDDLAAAGLYDPAAPDAAERRALLELALAAGADLDEIRLADEERWLHAVPVQRAILGGARRMSVAEAAGQAGLGPEVAARLWAALGLEERGRGACSEADVALFAWYARSIEIWGETETVHLARVTGAALASLADAEVSQVRAAIEAPLRAGGGDNIAVAERYAEIGREVLPGLQDTVLRVHAHHLSVAGRRYALWGLPPTEESTTELTVGFADLVGFTALGHLLKPAQVDALLRRFEERAHEASTGSKTRLVKLIGDEAMFVAGSATEGLAIATSLVSDPDLPPMRVGLASGEVVTRGGDVFGPPVNLAARLVATAAPGEILFDAATADSLDDPTAVVARGTRDLVGFPEPVAVFSVS
ncbi:MAG: adenylate/guanylate cyclase domain-containing protein [Acidimicrobiia bacterium]